MRPSLRFVLLAIIASLVWPLASFAGPSFTRSASRSIR